MQFSSGSLAMSGGELILYISKVVKPSKCSKKTEKVINIFVCIFVFVKSFSGAFL